MSTIMQKVNGRKLEERDWTALATIIDSAFTPDEKEAIQGLGQDEEVLEHFIPMFTTLKDIIRYCVMTGDCLRFPAEQIRECRRANATGTMEDGTIRSAATTRPLSEKQTQILQDKTEHILEHFQSTIVDKHIVLNSKLTNHMASQVAGPGLFQVSVSAAAKHSTPTKVLCGLAYENGNLNLSGRRPFTEYDWNVYNALVSLYVYGDKSHIVTPQTVYRAMAGMTSTESPSKQQIKAVTESIGKMCFTRTVIICTNEIACRKSIPERKYPGMGMTDTHLLDATAVHVEGGDKAVRAYRINSAPVLCSHSRLLNEMLTVPLSLLDIRTDTEGNITDERVSNTESRIQTKGYLLRQIEGMKGSHFQKSRTISLNGYDKDGVHDKGLYEIAGLADGATRKMQKSIRDYAGQVLFSRFFELS